MGKVKKRASKRMSSKQVAKVDKKIRRFKRDARRTARKLKNKGILGVQRKEQDPALLVPNTWPGKEQILQQAAMEREQALEEKRRKKEAAKKVREWEKANPDKAKVKKARAEARALQLEEAKKEAAKASQHFPTQVRKVVPRCNCVIQVLDARAPFSSISPSIEKEIITSQQANSSRPLVAVYILNKADLVPRSYIESTISALTEALKDDPQLKITRKVAAYSTHFTESPGMLMRLLQADWLKNAFRKKIVAAVLGYPNTGKKSIIRDLEVTSKTVSVHAASQVPGNPTSKIPGATEVALITFPRDSKVESREATGFNVIFKQNDAIAAEIVGKKVADHAVSNAAASVSTFYKISKAKSGTHLLESLCKKRGFYKDSDVHLPAACSVLVNDLNSGKLLFAEQLPEIVKKLTKKDEALHCLLPVVKQCTVADVKLITADKDCFKLQDYDLSEITGKEKKAIKKAEKKIARENGDEPMQEGSEGEEELEELEEFEEDESMEDPEAYKFNDAEWSDEEGEEEEFEEIEEDKE